jgi:hypothetical protein
MKISLVGESGVGWDRGWMGQSGYMLVPVMTETFLLADLEILNRCL